MLIDGNLSWAQYLPVGGAKEETRTLAGKDLSYAVCEYHAHRGAQGTPVPFAEAERAMRRAEQRSWDRMRRSGPRLPVAGGLRRPGEQHRLRLTCWPGCFPGLPNCRAAHD